jgi:hypothetical protein
VREHLLDAAEERVTVLLEGVEETTVHAETGGRVDHLLALCRAFLALEKFEFFRQRYQPPARKWPALVADPRAWYHDGRRLKRGVKRRFMNLMQM